MSRVAAWRWGVIEGFRIDVTADELVHHLDERVRYHRDRAERCLQRAKKFENLDPTDAMPTDPDGDEEDVEPWWPGFSEELERRANRHRTRELYFIFLRDRIVMSEIYRLGVADLRSLEWLPLEQRAEAT